MRHFFIYILFIICLFSCTKQKSAFVECRDGKLWLNQKPYKFVGANLWYGSMLASEGRNGNREALLRELDELHSLGINNLRVMAGADGYGNEPWRVTPCLQTSPGVYNDTLLCGLDFLLSEMGKRGMKAVIFLNNAWDWSGGYVFYLQHSEKTDRTPNLNDDGYPAYIEYASKFSTDTIAQNLFFDHIRFMLSRVNRFTGIPYTEDPAIMTWQIGNEPRAFSDEVKPQFADWLKRASSLIRSLDPNHLISIGSEGIWGCDGDEQLHRQICSDINISYITAHIWPLNWSWLRKDSIIEYLPKALANTEEYLEKHILLAKELHKPLIIEEFGMPRDGLSFSPCATTTARDIYYNKIATTALNTPEISGFNFWTWSGSLLPDNEIWKEGDGLTGDPPQEQQGLNSVFISDTTTINILKQTVAQLSK